MTALDIIVLLLVGGAIVAGSLRGFVGEILSLLAWVAAILALKVMHAPMTQALIGVVGTYAGAAVLSFALVFGVVFLCGKLVAKRIGEVARTSAVGPLDRIIGGGFGALKGLIGAAMLFLAANLFYDTFYGRAAARPNWMAQSRTYPLLHASGDAIVNFVERRRAQPVDEEEASGNSAQTEQ